MRAIFAALTPLCLMPLLAAQSTNSVNDVGLLLLSANSIGTVGGGTAGQSCGAFTCTAFTASPMQSGTQRVVQHYGAPSSFFAVAIGFASPCIPIAGVGNQLMLLPVPATLGVGVTGVTSPNAACQQGRAALTLALPAGTPAGIQFRLQSLGVSNSGVLALSPAIDVVTQ